MLASFELSKDAKLEDATYRGNEMMSAQFEIMLTFTLYGSAA